MAIPGPSVPEHEGKTPAAGLMYMTNSEWERISLLTGGLGVTWAKSSDYWVVVMRSVTFGLDRTSCPRLLPTACPADQQRSQTLV